MGATIYFGIRVDMMEEALTASALAMLAIILSSLTYQLFAANRTPSRYRFMPTETFCEVTALVLLATSLLMLMLFAVNINKFSLPKVVKVASVSFIHYKLVLLWMAAFTVHFSTKWEIDRPLIISFTIFCLYTLLFSERDFVFIILAVTFITMKSRILNYRLALIGFPVAMLLTQLTADRGEIFEGGPVSAFFNQGSNLFVNSFVIGLVEDGEPLQYGYTYLSSMLDSISFGKLRLDEPLAEWLVGAYTGNPDADAGYGFSLEAEAFLNFGYAGVFILYFLLGLLMVQSSQRALQGYFLARLHVTWTPIFMIYGLRGESLNIMKPYLYCWAIILLARILVPLFSKEPSIVAPADAQALQNRQLREASW
ncbi:MAG: O-antigen polysaccharide polymerase Wzy [Thiolinea sp.]